MRLLSISKEETQGYLTLAKEGLDNHILWLLTLVIRF
jgi:hypothetical protein